MADRYVIFNADDFGASDGVNRGIVEGHVRGVVTSTSFLVTGRRAEEAAAMSRDHPGLALGLHWDVWGEDERSFDLDNPAAVRDEFHRQLDRFHRLIGRPPTHVDSHKHAHRRIFELFQELVGPLGVPLRDDGQVRYVSHFYAQWEWKVTNLEYVSVPFLQQVLRDEVRDGWNELSCHPGYVSPDYDAVYLSEREEELRSLTDPRIPETLSRLDIRLASYADFTRLTASSGG